MSKQSNHKPQNSRSKKEEKLEELLLFLFEIFPNKATQNPFYKVSLNQYVSKYSYLHKLLTHFLTLIYQSNRIMENKGYITQREDVLASLQILEIVSLEAYREENEIIEDCYQKLKNNSLPNQELPRKFIEGIIQKRKSQTNRIIKVLQDRGYLKLVGGHRNRGYLYQIMEVEIEEKKKEKISKTNLKTTKSNTIFEEIQAEFNDNQNIEYQYRKDNFRF